MTTSIFFLLFTSLDIILWLWLNKAEFVSHTAVADFNNVLISLAHVFKSAIFKCFFISSLNISEICLVINFCNWQRKFEG